MTVNQLVLVGDSLPQGQTGFFGYQFSGSVGTFYQIIADRLANIPGLGPLVSSGVRQADGLGQYGWSFTTSTDAWSDALSTDAWDKGLYGVSTVAATKTLHYASGATKIATYTADASIRYPNVGFQVTWVDYTNGGTWSYSTDGGSNWTNVPDTPTHGNALRKFYVATPITSASTIKFRGANAAGTAQGCCIHNIEIFYQTPSTAAGLIVHDAAVAGAELHDLVASTSGDRMAWFDSVTLGSGSPIANTPNLGTIVMHINDVFRASKSGWASDLTTFNTRVSLLGPVGIMSPWECNTAAYPAGGGNGQSDYRTQTKTSAAGFTPAAKVLDCYDLWSAMGITGNTQTIAAGFLFDGTHLSQAGHRDLADRIYWFVRNQIIL